MPKFYQLSRAERIAELQRAGILGPDAADLLRNNAALEEETADHLTENQIAQYPLPLGVVHKLRVNGVQREVAIAGEEPSVVAAASNGARMAAIAGGVRASAPRTHLVDAEIAFTVQVPAAQRILTEHDADIRAVAERAHPSIVQRGGGLRTITYSEVGSACKVTLSIDVQEAMGANIVNTIAEAVSHLLSHYFQQEPLFAILTNYSAATTTAQIDLPFAAVATKQASGEHVAAKIAAASDFACQDVARASTNNKGIMNGISGAAIALGQDYRALEAGVYAYAAHTGRYMPLSHWTLTDTGLHGELSLPLALGTVGGAISALPLAQVSQELARIDNVRTAQEVLAALGLVQNLAALRALVGPGIQAGHMALQAGALAIAAGATGAEVDLVTRELQNTPKTLAAARMLLEQLRKHKEEQ
ncbi:hydroxymethylglutaryl-CoA reductase, degradative [Lacticaseibacillus zhaodongensis]|uniref:hydroxymethylglutaryl-CoA reductase, degradative n=1 Tax=Lacticaseibacillus zhaodongensis TaxID=2668065 RepID=UPI0018AFE52C|nr:hydroxymethylglutaryl-CoA reductase, degradative [Lacticaseibacillus zhaodongensis]